MTFAGYILADKPHTNRSQWLTLPGGSGWGLKERTCPDAALPAQHRPPRQASRTGGDGAGGVCHQRQRALRRVLFRPERGHRRRPALVQSRLDMSTFQHHLYPPIDTGDFGIQIRYWHCWLRAHQGLVLVRA